MGLDDRPSLWLYPDDQAQLTSLLEHRGYSVTLCPGLAAAYDEPLRDAQAWLARC